MTAATKCEFCDKRGLPLLLVRDAVAPSKSGAPIAPSLPIELASSAAHYTKRLLRSGYVNVFDEARRRWETYFVTKDNYFSKLLQMPGITPVVPKKPFNCPDEGHRAIASCITVSDPLNASKVWIGFSDVLWTDAVRKANEDAIYRKRHMTEIDVKAVLKGNQTPHRPIKQLDAIVAEYAMAPAQAKATLGWSPFDFSSRHGRAERLKQECETLRPSGGLIVTLHDPAGIAQELAFLMRRNANLFIDNNPEDKRRLAASASIDQIEAAVRNKSVNSEIASAEYLEKQREAETTLGHVWPESTRAQAEKLGTVTATDLTRAEESEWKKYSNKFDNEARKLWHSAFEAKLKDFDATFIAPLALNHVAWMKSTALADYFNCNYDPHHPESGTVYTMVFTHCATATQDKRACADLYDEWLKGDISDTKNLLLRAMVLNLNVPANAVKSATAVSISLRQIPWDNIFAAYTTAVERVSQGAQEVFSKLIAQFGGPITRMFGKVMDGSSGFRAAVMATGLISGHPIVICEISGTKRHFRAHLIKQLLQASGDVISESQMQRAVRAEMKRQQIEGVPLEGSTRKRWVLIADKEMIARIPSGLSPQARADWLARSVKTVEAVEALNLNRWRTVINDKVRSGAIAGLLQLLSLTKLVEDEGKSLAHDKVDASRRLYAGVAGIAANMSETIGNVLAKRAELGMNFGQGISTKLGLILQTAGRIVGVCAGLAMALLDGLKFGEAQAENQPGLAWLYGASAIAGISLTVLIAFPSMLGAMAIPVIGLLIVIAIVIGILIEHIKDNPVQDWLERCPWGILKSQRYANMETEQAQLKQALAES